MDSDPSPSRRRLWVEAAERVATPVLEAAAEGHLRRDMPIEVSPVGNREEREAFSHLEAMGRWTERPQDGRTDSG